MIYGNNGFCVLSGFLIGKGLFKPLLFAFLRLGAIRRLERCDEGRDIDMALGTFLRHGIEKARSMCADREGLILVGAIGFSM